MNCKDARQHWNLYHDSEGDARMHFEIGEHLAHCAPCAEWFAKQSRFESILVEKIRTVPLTPELWDRVLASTALKPKQRSRRGFWAVGLAASVLLVVLASAWFYQQRSTSKDLAGASAEWHERINTGREPLQIQSTSDQEVDDFLRGQVPFPVRCPPRKDAGFAVRGAGIGNLSGHSAAFIIGDVGNTPISIFVLPRDSLKAFASQQATTSPQGLIRSHSGPYTLVLREFDQNAVVVIGRTTVQDLERVVNAYGSYPDHHERPKHN